MKRLSLSLAAIGFSSSIFAALPAATDPTIVNVPQLDGGFVIGLMGDYLRPNPTHGDLDFFRPVFIGSSPLNATFYDIDPSYQWGWGANIGYVFPQTGNDINLSYSHLDADDSRTLSPGELATFGGTISPLVFSYFLANGSSEYNLNQVDLTVGQMIDVGCRLRLHPNAGLRWASLDRKLSSNVGVGLASTGVEGSFTSLLTISSQEESDFDGIGPLAGLDASYYIGMGFGAVAHVDGALLIGSIDSKLNAALTIAASDPALFEPSETDSNTINSNDRVVPVVDAKLGLDYTYLFNNAANSNLTLEAGWQASQYYNAVDNIVGTEGITERITSRVGFNGPYATLTLHA